MTINTTAVSVCLAAIPTENFNSVLRVLYIYMITFSTYEAEVKIYSQSEPRWRPFGIKCVSCLVLVESIFCVYVWTGKHFDLSATDITFFIERL